MIKMSLLAKDLKKKFLELLEEDKEFRYTVAGILGYREILERIERLEAEMVRLREDMQRGFERVDKILLEHAKRIERLEAEMVRLREDMQRGFERFDRHLSAIGARWGIESEEAFREGLRGLVEKELGYRVEKWTHYDSEGVVYGYPSEVDIDVVVQDSRVILVEITSHAKVSDVYELVRKKRFFESATGKRVDRLVLITPYAEEKALEAAKKHGVQLYTNV